MAQQNLDVITSLGKYILADGFDMVVDLDKSNGYWLHDSKHDKTYLDFFSFFASAPIGFNHPKMVNDAEFLKNLRITGLHKVSNSDFYTTHYADFVETFGRVAIHEPMKHSFFVSGGALAVENALKAAFDWKVRKNLANGSDKELGSQVLHFNNAFHGRTGYTMSLTNTADPRKYMYYPRFDWPRVLNPGIKFPLEDNLDHVKNQESISLDQINKAFDDNPNDIAAIIIEPIQSEGGDIHFRDEYLRNLRKIADDREAMLIYDEVQTGVGMTGKMWAYEHYEGAAPDLMSFGKKTQICGFLSSDRIDEVENNVFVESSRINSTWGGNLVDMVRSQKYLEIIEEDRLVDNAAKMGAIFLKNLTELDTRYEKMSNVRGLGLLVAFDLTSTEERNRFKDLMFKENIMVLESGTHSIRIRPPLNVDQEAVDIFITAVDKVFKNFYN